MNAHGSLLLRKQAFSQLARAQEAHSMANLARLRAILSTAQMVVFLAWFVRLLSRFVH